MQIQKMQNFVQDMFRPIIRTDKTYVGCKHTNFITSSGIFQALFFTERCMSSVKTLLASVEVSQDCSPYSTQISCYSILSTRIS